MLGRLTVLARAKARVARPMSDVRKMDPWPIYFRFWCLMTNTTKLD